MSTGDIITGGGEGTETQVFDVLQFSQMLSFLEAQSVYCDSPPGLIQPPKPQITKNCPIKATIANLIF